LVKPYQDFCLQSGIKLRLFKENVEEDELIWHQDERDREITIVDGVGWKLQFDDKLPFDLEINETYKIPKMVYHRLHKGEGNLLVNIKER